MVTGDKKALRIITTGVKAFEIDRIHSQSFITLINKVFVRLTVTPRDFASAVIKKLRKLIITAG